ncbi:MAG TPA: cytochrome c oxidase accessory protein CcoG [Steroidobacteraceae bacterium]|nr:cytochrome c oxidase accessory protein CcoG [Steroidobacteraceae bacterium]
MNAPRPQPTGGPPLPPAEPVSFYAKHVKIHPREVQGRFDRLRRIAVFTLLGLFYLVPWLKWGGHPAVLFDLPARKFWILGLVLWPQDFIFLTWILVMLGLSLFFVTALAGRLWCGFACPQTVWTEVFVWLERLVEGDRARRLKLERAPWTAGKIARKGAKQALWIVFSLWTGLSFVGFFVPLPALTQDLLSRTLTGWALFWTAFYGAATYFNAGYLREQVCKYMCPYARFQSAMFDRDTLIITYDAARGEPRGARARNVDHRARGLGDCVDCTVCVQVCPTGIDIRQGLQYECIACAACIDACDGVMDRVGYPRGLIRYTTQNALEGRQSRVLRPRTFVYATLLGAIFVAGLAGLLARKTVAVDVIRDRNALYQETASGEIENVYNLKILNKDSAAHSYRLAVEGIDGARIDAPRTTWRVEGGEVYSVPLRVAVPAGTVRGGHDIRFVLTDADGPARRVTEKARFIAR